MAESANAKELMKGVTKRVDIAPIIESIQKGEFKPRFSKEDIDKMPVVGREMALGPWTEMKEDEAALESIFISEIYPHLLKQHELWADKEYGDATRETKPERIVNALMHASLDMARAAIRSWRDGRERRLASTLSTEKKDHLDDAYDYYKSMVEFGRKNKIGFYDDTSASLLERGMSTAVNTFWALVHLVPELAKQKGITLTEEQMAQAVESGYGPLIMVFMSMNTEVSTPLQNGMMEETDEEYSDDFKYEHFKKEFFDLVPDGAGGYKLSLDHDKLMNIVDAQGEPVLNRVPKSKTTWCPVRYTNKTGQVDVMSELFKLWMEEAKKRYFPRLSTP